jgi:hypothetical protein
VSNLAMEVKWLGYVARLTQVERKGLKKFKVTHQVKSITWIN